MNKKYNMEMLNKILDAIVAYMQEHGYSPSVREIGEMVGLQSTSSVQHYMYQLYELGLIESDCENGAPRAIRVPGYKFVKVEEE